MIGYAGDLNISEQLFYVKYFATEGGVIPYSIIFYFFLSLITDFVEAIYAFGLLGLSFPPELASVLFLFTPALILLMRRGLPRRALLWLGIVVLLAGAAGPMLDTRERMLISGAGAGAFLMFLPALLTFLGSNRRVSHSPTLGAGLVAGTALFIALRAWNSGVSPSGHWLALALGWLLALVGGFWLNRELAAESAGMVEVHGTRWPAPFGRTVGLSLGIMSALILLYFAFASPHVLARWTGYSYPLTLVLTGLALTGFAFLLFLSGRSNFSIPYRWLLLANILFVACLVGVILPFQVSFPANPGAYPYLEPPPSPLAILPYLGMLILLPVLPLNFTLFCQEMIAMCPSARRSGAAFLLASLFLLVMIFAQVFTTVYDYAPVIGPFFRDRFWLVYLIAGLGLALPVLLVSSPQHAGARGLRNLQITAGPGLLVLGLSAASVIGALVNAARPAAPPAAPQALRVLSYNIQQGYDAAGERGHTEVLRLMRQLDADLIGLQESDTNRISGGNADLVRYFADRLDMHVYFGPKTVTGTFGIALLSKYPLMDPKTVYLYSEGEQTAALSAEVQVADRIWRVFVTHLGNGGPLVQQENFLDFIAGQENVIAMGDFNFRPEGEQYALTARVLNDAWLQRWPQGVDGQGKRWDRRIDHVFLSPGVEVIDAGYLDDPASDHPALLVEIRP